MRVLVPAEPAITGYIGSVIVEELLREGNTPVVYDSLVIVWGRNLQFGKEGARHLLVVMLPSVNDDFLMSRFTQCAADRRQLDKLRARANDRHKLHDRVSAPPSPIAR